MISRRLRSYLHRHRREYLEGFTFSVLATAAGMTAPWVLRHAVDGIRGGIGSHVLLGLATLYVGLYLVSAVLRFFWRVRIIGASRNIEYEIRNDYFAHLQRLHLSFFQHTRTGDLMARAVNDLNAVQRVVGIGVMHAVNTPLLFVVASVLMFSLDVRLATYVLVILPLVSLTFVVLGRQVHRRFERVQAQFGDISARAQENFSGIRVVKAFAQEPYEIDTFAGLNREFIRRNLELIKVSGTVWPSMTLILGIASVLVLWQGGQAVIQGRITLGTLVQFFAYLGQLSWPMIALGWVLNIIQQGLASMGRLDEIFNTRPAIADHADPKPVAQIEGQVEFRNVAFAYPVAPSLARDGGPNGQVVDGAAREVLRDISLRIPAGSTLAVVGPTGSGKSTLVSLIPRLFDPTRGEVLIDGVDARRLALATLRRAIGFVAQEPFLFSESIAENVTFGVEAGTRQVPGELVEAGTGQVPGELVEAGRDGAGDGEGEERRVVEAAEIAQLAADVRDFPHGYATILGERGVTLSGGQKQRATLARALARDPAILILDDALSSVDTHTEERILQGLRGVMATRTSIIISHRVSTVRHADQIVVLDDGRIVERGTHGELVALGGLYADLYQKQLLSEELEADETAAGEQ